MKEVIPAQKAEVIHGGRVKYNVIIIITAAYWIPPNSTVSKITNELHASACRRNSRTFSGSGHGGNAET